MDNDLIAAVATHIRQHIGEPDEVLHELIPTSSVHIDLHIVKPTVERPFYTVVTSGMSELPLPIPEELEGRVPPYMELMLCLPADWKVGERTSPRWNWPLKWLQILAKYPHDYNTWFFVAHTIPNGDPAEPFGPGTEQCCWFIRPPENAPEAFLELQHGDRTILFISPTAIYASEMEFALSDGHASPVALHEALEAAGVTELVAPDRPPVR